VIVFKIVLLVVVTGVFSETAFAQGRAETGGRQVEASGSVGMALPSASGEDFCASGSGRAPRDAGASRTQARADAKSGSETSSQASHPVARHPDAKRLGQDIEDEDAARHPPKRETGSGGPWLMNLTVGAAFPLKASRAPAKAGFLVTLIGGRRLVQVGRLDVAVGIAASMLTVRAKDEAVLNPDAAEAERVTCKDYKGLNLWTAEAALTVDLRWPRMILGLTGFVGGGYGQYRQVNEHATGQVLACGYDEVGAWVPTVGGSLHVGWVFSKAVELSFVGGIRAMFSNRRLVYEDVDGNPTSVPVFFHAAHVGLSFVHRF